MLDSERQSNFIKTDDRRISVSALQTAQILLGEAGFLGELLLRQALFEPDLPHVPPDQFPHIHTDRLDHYIL